MSNTEATLSKLGRKLVVFSNFNDIPNKGFQQMEDISIQHSQNNIEAIYNTLKSRNRMKSTFSEGNEEGMKRNYQWILFFFNCPHYAFTLLVCFSVFTFGMTIFDSLCILLLIFPLPFSHFFCSIIRLHFHVLFKAIFQLSFILYFLYFQCHG